jgi:large subunit ribosomal protein L14
VVNYLTRLKVSDNSGARDILCIKILGGSFVEQANSGKMLVIVIKRSDPTKKKMPRGLICRAVITRATIMFFRGCGV